MKPCWAPYLEMSPKHFTMATGAVLYIWAAPLHSSHMGLNEWHVVDWLQWLSDRFLWTAFSTFQMSHRFEKCPVRSLLEQTCVHIGCTCVSLSRSHTHTHTLADWSHLSWLGVHIGCILFEVVCRLIRNGQLQLSFLFFRWCVDWSEMVSFNWAGHIYIYIYSIS